MYNNRDISWLEFNHCVLKKAADKDVPLMERIKFLSIFSSNMDEFFRVRYPVISLYGQLKNKTRVRIIPPPDKDLTEKVQELIDFQFNEFGKILNEELLPELWNEKIALYYYKPVPALFTAQVREVFLSKILTFIQPVFIKESFGNDFFPESNKIYFLVLLKKENETLLQHAIVNIPTSKLPRFFTLESEDDIQHIVFLDDIIRDNLSCIFIGFQIHACFSFKITRDAELYLNEENYQKDILKELQKKLKKRDQGTPTRFLYEEGMPISVQQFLGASLNLRQEQLFKGRRYHNLSDLSSLPVRKKELHYPILKQLKSPHIEDCEDILKSIDKKDILLHLPYDSYNPVLTFFNQAAIDPDVKSIYITLYRVAANSHIVNALISAAKNKKEVVVFIELKARFDEANNIQWAKEMEEAGIRIIYSIPKIKVHSKIALINKHTEKENKKSYAFIGTGNFNETTARFYTDHVLLTKEDTVIRDLQKLFHLLSTRTKPTKRTAKEFNSILVSQYNMINIFEQEIKAQIKRKKKNLPALIRIKLNNLEDISSIDLLYKAGRAGVPIQLIVRGICCLNPQEEQLNDNIQIKRIIDRFLEHSRVFIFGENDNKKVYIGSCDWMTRNLYHRIEVSVPVKEKALADELQQYFDIQWNNTSKNETCSQSKIYQYLKMRP